MAHTKPRTEASIHIFLNQKDEFLKKLDNHNSDKRAPDLKSSDKLNPISLDKFQRKRKVVNKYPK